MYLYNSLYVVTSFLAALAEILSVKEVSARKLYYVHYIDCEYRVVVFFPFLYCFIHSELNYNTQNITANTFLFM